MQELGDQRGEGAYFRENTVFTFLLHKYSCRNPYKKKSAIQDWHLILLVFTLLLINVAVLCLHVLLEGVINKFNLTTVPNKERSFRIEGVRHYIIDLVYFRHRSYNNYVIQAIQTDLYIYSCSSHHWIRLFILGLIYGLTGILQTVAL